MPSIFNKMTKMPLKFLKKTKMPFMDFDQFDQLPDIQEQVLNENLDFILQFTYNSKEDVVFAVKKYHSNIRRQFHVVKSDKSRYYVKCPKENCNVIYTFFNDFNKFVLRFNFKDDVFGPPTSSKIHSCNILEFSTSKDINDVSFISKLDHVETWFQAEGRNATPAGLKRHLNALGVDPSYHTLLRTLAVLKTLLCPKEVNMDCYSIMLKN